MDKLAHGLAYPKKEITNYFLLRIECIGDYFFIRNIIIKNYLFWCLIKILFNLIFFFFFSIFYFLFNGVFLEHGMKNVGGPEDGANADFPGSIQSPANGDFRLSMLYRFLLLPKLGYRHLSFINDNKNSIYFF